MNGTNAARVATILQYLCHLSSAASSQSAPSVVAVASPKRFFDQKPASALYPQKPLSEMSCTPVATVPLDKNEKRKMQNRIHAQNARDRKKRRMDYLEQYLRTNVCKHEPERLKGAIQLPKSMAGNFYPDAGGDPVLKRRRRTAMNRSSARSSRARAKAYLEALEQAVEHYKKSERKVAVEPALIREPHSDLTMKDVPLVSVKQEKVLEGLMDELAGCEAGTSEPVVKQEESDLSSNEPLSEQEAPESELFPIPPYAICQKPDDMMYEQQKEVHTWLQNYIDTETPPPAENNSPDQTAVVLTAESAPQLRTEEDLPAAPPEAMEVRESHTRSEDDLKLKVLQNDQALKDWIVNGEGFYINHSLPQPTYMIDPKVRASLLSEQLRDQLRVPTQWSTGFFQFEPFVEDTSTMAQAMLGAVNDCGKKSKKVLGECWIAKKEEKESEVAVAKEDDFKAGQPRKTDDSYLLSLKDKTPAEKAGTLALFNHSSSKTISVEPEEGQVIELLPDTGLLLSRQSSESKTWQYAGRYASGEKMLETNPLLRDSPLIARGENQDIDDSNVDGEYFLNRQALADRAAAQSRKAGRPAPAVCMNRDELTTHLIRFRNSPESTRSLIFGYEDANHYVAVRLIKNTDRVIVYINETLDQKNSVSCSIQQIILNSARSLLPDHKIFFLTPGFEGQKDFSSCGVTVLKALRAFDKRSELDEWLVDTVEKRPSSYIKNKGDKTHSAIPKRSRIALTEMSPWLLKTYQGKLASLTDEQRRAVVSHPDKENQRSLEKYIERYQKDVPSLTKPGARSKPNFSGYCKRYKYLLKWEQALAQPEAGQPVPDDQESRLSDAEIRSQLLPLQDVGSLDEANSFLEKYFPDMTPPISEQEWDLMVDFESIVLAKKRAGATAKDNDKLLKIFDWLKGIQEPKEESQRIHNQLLLLWLDYILESSKTASEWRGLSLSKTSERLQAKIQSAFEQPVRQGRKRPLSAGETPFSKRKK